jgi:hypothetical protein
MASSVCEVGQKDESMDTEWAEHVLSLASERFERRLGDAVGGLRKEMYDGFTGIRQEMSNQRAELLKWSFGFWVSQFAATAALLFYLLRSR